MASIQRRPNGMWRARVRLSNGREIAKHCSTKNEAQEWIDNQKADLRSGTFADPRRGKVTVGEWSEQWKASRVHLKEKTLVGYESLLSSCILPTWQNTRLSDVTNAGVASWVAELRSRLSASRTRQAYHLFTSILDSAVLDRRLAVNPAAGVRLPRLPRNERRYLTHDELHHLAAECGDNEDLVLVLGYTGMRWGEAAALRAGAVDLLRGRIRVVEAMTEVNGRAVFGPPKTHQERALPLPAFLRELLALRLAGKAPDDLVFPSPRGEVLRVGNFRRSVFDRASRAAGLGGLVPHELRHTAASLAIASGASVKAVQAMLGHRSATLTLDRYGHLFGDELDAIADRMDAAVRAAADSARTGGPSRLVNLAAG